MKSEYFKEISIVYIAVTILFLLYGVHLISNGNKFSNIAKLDILNTVVYNNNGIRLSGWGISHFVMYLLIGLICPHCWKEATVLGIIWEVVESILGNIFVNDTSDTTDSNIKYKLWWDGDPQDIVINSIGLICGILINKCIT